MSCCLFGLKIIALGLLYFPVVVRFSDIIVERKGFSDIIVERKGLRGRYMVYCLACGAITLITPLLCWH